MKLIIYRRICTPLILLLSAPSFLMAQSNKEWSGKKAEEWFKTQEWLKRSQVAEARVEYDLFGNVIEKEQPDSIVQRVLFLDLTQLKLPPSVNKEEFAKQYHAHKEWWDQAFAFLQYSDLAGLKPGKYVINGDKVFATITEGPAKRTDTTKWESHRNYQDIHYVIKGKEKIGITPVSSLTVTDAYEPERDIVFYKGDGKYYTADTDDYFIFFPQDAHRPNLKIEDCGMVKRIVIKIKRNDQ